MAASDASRVCALWEVVGDRNAHGEVKTKMSHVKCSALTRNLHPLSCLKKSCCCGGALCSLVPSTKQNKMSLLKMESLCK